MRTETRWIGFLLTTLLVSIPAFAQVGARNINKGTFNTFSLEQEIALGREHVAQLESQVKLVDDSTILEYVNRVGQTLVRNSDAGVPFTFKVVKSGEFNGLALPGGFVYVNTSLILAMSNESELAAAMAHLIAQVSARRHTENAARAALTNTLTIPLIVPGGPTGAAVRQTQTITIPLTFLQFSKAQTIEADSLGVEYMYQAGYDPEGTVVYLQKIEALEAALPRTGASQLFAPMPPASDRIKATRVQIDSIQPLRGNLIRTTPEFDAIKTRLSMLN